MFVERDTHRHISPQAGLTSPTPLSKLRGFSDTNDIVALLKLITNIYLKEFADFSAN